MFIQTKQIVFENVSLVVAVIRVGSMKYLQNFVPVSLVQVEIFHLISEKI